MPCSPAEPGDENSFEPHSRAVNNGGFASVPDAAVSFEPKEPQDAHAFDSEPGLAFEPGDARFKPNGDLQNAAACDPAAGDEPTRECSNALSKAGLAPEPGAAANFKPNGDQQNTGTLDSEPGAAPMHECNPGLCRAGLVHEPGAAASAKPDSDLQSAAALDSELGDDLRHDHRSELPSPGFAPEAPAAASCKPDGKLLSTGALDSEPGATRDFERRPKPPKNGLASEAIPTTLLTPEEIRKELRAKLSPEHAELLLQAVLKEDPEKVALLFAALRDSKTAAAFAS